MRCKDKIRFSEKQDAERARFSHEETHQVDKGELRTYRCHECGDFHNGHRSPPSRAAEHSLFVAITRPGHVTVGEVLLARNQ